MTSRSLHRAPPWLRIGAARRGHRDRVVAKVGQSQGPEQRAPLRAGSRPSAFAVRGRATISRMAAALVKQLGGPVRAHPRLERGVIGVGSPLRQRDLVGSPGSLDCTPPPRPGRSSPSACVTRSSAKRVERERSLTRDGRLNRRRSLRPPRVSSRRELLMHEARGRRRRPGIGSPATAPPRRTRWSSIVKKSGPVPSDSRSCTR